MKTLILKSFEGHKGRPGQHGGSLPKNASQFDMAPGVTVIITRDPEVTAPDTIDKAKALIMSLPLALRERSGIKKIEIYDDPEGSDRRIEELVPDEYIEGAQGMYNRRNGTVVAPIWSTLDSEDNGRVLLHEFGHSLGYLITGTEWNMLSDEWEEYDGNYRDKDEAFADLFSTYIITTKEWPEDLIGDDSYWNARLPGVTAFMKGLGL